ncbi:hypothetical protein CHUAL_007024 [Chamberlinius hualienensis]
MGCIPILILQIVVCVLLMSTIGFMTATIVLAVNFNRHKCIVSHENANDGLYNSNQAAYELKVEFSKTRCCWKLNVMTVVVVVLTIVVIVSLIFTLFWGIRHNRLNRSRQLETANHSRPAIVPITAAFSNLNTS